MPVSRFVILLALAACALQRAGAQESVIPVIPVEPPKESPFFVLNGEPENPGEAERKSLTSPQNDYPKNKTADVSAGRMFASFFTDMFASVRVGRKPSTGSKLEITPSKFSLDDRREITVKFTVANKGGKLLKLDFPNSQRIEILVHDPSGKVIEKWSDDRAFVEESGIVMINPGEKIQYEEKISTRDMQPGQTYTIEASMANNPEFTKAVNVTPTGKPRNAPPNPALQPQPPGGSVPPAPSETTAAPPPNQG